MKTHYDVLGVHKSATAIEIKKAFRDKAKMYHPDVSTFPNAHELFIPIGEAYAILKNPKTRADYDHYLAQSRSTSNAKQTNHYANYSNDFEKETQQARAEAVDYASISLDELISAVLGFALNTGKALLVGEKNKPKANILDYLKMGFLGFILTICIIISFTGIGTVPGVMFSILIISGLFKNDRFLGIIPFIISTLVADVLVVILIFSMISKYL